MITLEEIYKQYKPFGMGDYEIIREYIIDNNLESEFLKLIPELAEKQVNKIKYQLDYARTWIPSMPDFPIEDKVQKQYLTCIAQYTALGMDLPEQTLEWAKENIPKLNIPEIYFVPAIIHLRDKYGIEFADAEKWGYTKNNTHEI